MLELKNINKKFGNTLALHNINLEFQKGKIYLLLGPNGAGKTTLNQIISGILFPDTGQIIYNDALLQTSKKIPYSISYLGDTDLFDEKLSVLVFLKLIAKLKSPNNSKNSIEEVLNLFDLQDVKNKRIQNLSLGYRQRVGLAQAFLGKSDILILDEPGSGLDPLQFQDLKKSIHKIKNDTIVIISTHRIREAKELAESVILLFEGKVLYKGDPSQKLTDALIHRFTLDHASQQFENYLQSQNINYSLSETSTYNLENLSLDQKLKILQFLVDKKIDIIHLESSEQSLESLYFNRIKN